MLDNNIISRKLFDNCLKIFLEKFGNILKTGGLLLFFLNNCKKKAAGVFQPLDKRKCLHYL
jgi:hypothetical protein